MSNLFDEIKTLTDHQLAMTIGKARPPKLPPRGAHPISRQFPAMGEVPYRALVNSIRDKGQQHAVAMLHGYIWEGRARYAACVELGLVPKVYVLRIKDPVVFLLRRNAGRFGEPKSTERYDALRILEKIDGKDWKQQEKTNRSRWIAYERDEFRKIVKVKRPCAVCGLGADYSHAHHLIPLTLQYDLGVETAAHDREWVCPVHHRTMHQMIGAIITGTRYDDFTRGRTYADKRKQAENDAAFTIFDRSVALLGALGGFARPGNWNLIP